MINCFVELYFKLMLGLMDSGVNEIKLILNKYDSPLVCIIFIRFSFRKLAQDLVTVILTDVVLTKWTESGVFKSEQNQQLIPLFLNQAQQKAQPTLVRLAEQINLQQA